MKKEQFSFQQLRSKMLCEANVQNFLQFERISSKHAKLHDNLIYQEFMRGYPVFTLEDHQFDLHDLKLLTRKEFDIWLKKFRAVKKAG